MGAFTVQPLGDPGPVSAKGAEIDDDPATVYSAPWSAEGASVMSVHVEFDSPGSDLEATVQLWASNKPKPDESDDSDWVQDTAVTFTGITAAASAKEIQEVGNAGSAFYRLKIERSAGSGTVSVWVNSKPGHF